MKLPTRGRFVKPIVPQNEGHSYFVEVLPRMLIDKRKGLPPITDKPEKRGAVSGFSPSSSKRLKRALCSVKLEHGLPLIVTLTYPAEFTADWTRWKRDLHNWRRSMWDSYGSQLIGGAWRLEAQRRGAPHYHVLLWTRFGDLSRPDSKMTLQSLREGIAEKWFKVVGSGDDDHFRAGTRVEPCRKGKGGYDAIILYLIKYTGKDSTHPDSQVFNRPVGRYWGIWQKDELLAEAEIYQISEKLHDQLRRMTRRKRDAKIRAFRKRSGRSGRGHKEGYNSTPLKQLGKPGFSEIMNRRTALKLLYYFDPIPF